MGALLVVVGAWFACSSPEPEVAVTDPGLTAQQCVYFAVNGKTTICHATGSPNNPVVIIQVNQQACINAHVNHPHDSVAVNGSCGPDACLAMGAPCDDTRACCDGLSCQAGVCAAPSCDPPDQLCDGSCTNVSSDPDNCGACGSQCGGQESCCAGACFDEQTDLEHCGGCGVVCAAPDHAECAAAVCSTGACGFTFQAAGTPVAGQTAGDCQVRQCDGGDSIASNPDNGDLPVDGNPCTEDLCVAGTPSNPPTAAGTSCGTGLVCDGAGTCVQCVSPSECPAPGNAECAAATCTGNGCGFAYEDAGTPVSQQTAGDCHVQVCDGAGNVADVIDDSDVPGDDNPCTDDVCVAGVPANPPVAAETSCGPDQVCDGQGGCVGCVTSGNCPAPTNPECAAAVCVASSCGFAYQAAGTPVAAQSAGDCLQSVCDGAGGVVAAADDSDVPVDGVECTLDLCDGGVPSNPPVGAGASCGNGMYCDGAGSCLECLVAEHCPAPQNLECAAAACTAGACGFAFQPEGTDVAAQAPGDCRALECDGSGNVVDSIDDTDRPNDSNPCTDDVCAGGVAANVPVGAGTVCGDGLMCDGQGACVDCVAATDCPPPANLECAASSCELGACGFDYQPAGTALSSQTSGDCRQQACDGVGGVVSAIADDDLPVDGNPCTDDVCEQGVAVNPPTAAETSCGAGMVCDGAGACVGCVVPANCPAPVNPQCASATCTAQSCGIASVPDGTQCTQPVPGTCSAGLCCSTTTITAQIGSGVEISIPASGTVGVAAPYPSIINVAGLAGSITKVTVTFLAETHTFPDDLDLLLVGPAGQSVILQSDSGGSFDVNHVILMFDDAASAALPDSTQIASGTYKPSNVGAGDAFVAPAPPGPYGSSLAVFTGTNPNGQWRLFAVDDSNGDTGKLGSCTLQITTVTPPVCQ
jgi:stigma-specific protein Stig1